MSDKKNAALLSICSNSFLVVIKFIIGFFTASISIISEAVHSLTDLVAAAIAYIAVKIADKPADESHPYGHEKVENISGVIEAILILFAAGCIIYEAVKKILHNEPVTDLLLGVIVMFISGTLNFFVSRHLYKVAKAQDSVAIEADALHLKVDVYTSFGVGLGLLIIYILKEITGLAVFYYLDPVVAIIVAVFILKEAYEMLMKAFRPLIDEKISNDELSAIQEIVSNYNRYNMGIHEIRTRKAGKIKHIDFHLTLPENLTLKQAHDICDDLEKIIENRIRNTKILIHVEPLCN